MSPLRTARAGRSTRVFCQAVLPRGQPARPSADARGPRLRHSPDGARCGRAASNDTIGA